MDDQDFEHPRLSQLPSPPRSQSIDSQLKTVLFMRESIHSPRRDYLQDRFSYTKGMVSQMGLPSLSTILVEGLDHRAPINSPDQTSIPKLAEQAFSNFQELRHNIHGSIIENTIISNRQSIPDFSPQLTYQQTYPSNGYCSNVSNHDQFIPLIPSRQGSTALSDHHLLDHRISDNREQQGFHGNALEQGFYGNELPSGHASEQDGFNGNAYVNDLPSQGFNVIREQPLPAGYNNMTFSNYESTLENPSARYPFQEHQQIDIPKIHSPDDSFNPSFQQGLEQLFPPTTQVRCFNSSNHTFANDSFGSIAHQDNNHQHGVETSTGAPFTSLLHVSYQEPNSFGQYQGTNGSHSLGQNDGLFSRHPMGDSISSPVMENLCRNPEILHPSESHNRIDTNRVAKAKVKPSRKRKNVNTPLVSVVGGDPQFHQGQLQVSTATAIPPTVDPAGKTPLPYKCRVEGCVRAYRTFNGRKNHEIQFHGCLPGSAPTSPKAVVSESGVLRPAYVHPRYRRYKCLVEGCEYKNKNMSGLRYHLRSKNIHPGLTETERKKLEQSGRQLGDRGEFAEIPVDEDSSSLNENETEDEFQ